MSSPTRSRSRVAITGGGTFGSFVARILGDECFAVVDTTDITDDSERRYSAVFDEPRPTKHKPEPYYRKFEKKRKW